MKVRFLSYGVLIFLCLLVPLQVQAQPGRSFSGEAAYEHVEFLANSIGPRPAGSNGEVKAGDYIAARLREYGWQVSKQEFSRSVKVDKGSLKK